MSLLGFRFGNKVFLLKGYYICFVTTIFCLGAFNANSQSYSINTSGAIPDSSAMLDIISSNKGLLIPRVSLTSTTDSTTIAHPAISLQVYNTNDSMTDGGKGFWYWNGTQWKRLSSDGSSSLWNISGNTGTVAGTNFIGTADTQALVFKTNNIERMRVLNSGRIGLGTATPTGLLDIANSSTSSALFISNTATVSAQFIGLQQTNSITPTTNNNVKGIDSRITISGTQSLTGGSAMVGFNSTNVLNTTGGTIANSSAFRASGSSSASGGTISNVIGLMVDNYSNLGGATIPYFFGVRVFNNTIATNINAGLSSVISAASNRWNLYIDGTAQNYLAGNLGIGTTTPLAPLHIVSSVVNSSLHERGGASYYYPGASQAAGGFTAYKARGTISVPTTVVNGDGMGAIFFGGYDGTNYLATAGITTIANGTITTGSIPTDLMLFNGSTNNGGTEKMRITSTGNVGIGLSSPTAKLHVTTSTANDVSIRTTHTASTGTNYGLIAQITGAATKNVGLYSSAINASTNYGLQLDNTPAGANNYALYSNSPAQSFFNGNVGIGTSSPVNKLDVEGGVAIGSTYSGTTASPTNGAIIEGDVGIGTTTPDIYSIGISTYKYTTIAAPTTGSNFGALNLAGGTTGGGALAFGNQTIRHAVIRSNNGSHLLFFTNGANSGNGVNERMRIDSIGRVGIGTASPNSTLEVKGSLSLSYYNANANYSITSSDYTIDVTTSCTITLPTASGIAGRIYYIKANGVSVTVATTSSQTIDGASPPTLASGKGLLVQSNGSHWIKILTN